MVKEFKSGTIFELGRVLLRCTKGSDCTKCYFFDKGSSCTVFTSEMVGHAGAWKDTIVNMSSLKKWERCVITARRIRENSTDYWGS